VEWIHLAEDGDRWRAVVNAVMNLRVVAPRSYLYIYGIRHNKTTRITNTVVYLHQPNVSTR
jgi:hypothetical protein